MGDVANKIEGVVANRIRYLVVVRGADEGARLVLNKDVKLVGRAHDAHLALNDRSVSRRHFHVNATEEGAYVYICAGEAPFLLDGREMKKAHVRAGASFVVGDTVFLVTEAKPDEGTAVGMADSASTTISSLFTGAAADVRGLANLFALNEALLAATDLPAIEVVFSSWCKAHASCASIETAPRPPPGATEHHEPLLESTAANDATKILVPARGAPTGWLAFVTKNPADSQRRLLVLAASLFASRFAQLSQLLTVKDEREAFRRHAVGSARAFLGTSAAAQDLVRAIPKLAASDATVLLLGETGVGKSFAARLIHEAGPRKEQPFRVINCASIPEGLIESELFGHARGAFSGAVAAQVGAFEAAGRGTVLLDEIGELPLASQTKLLHVLEDKKFERLGSTRSIPMEARIIAATNRDLEAMIAAGTFRSDLYFRISVVKATVPPLRERAEDIALLAHQILRDLVASGGRRADGFAPAALDVIRRYPWPGNVRELRNVIEHALVLGDQRLIEINDLPAIIRCIPAQAADAAQSEHRTLVELPMNEAQLQAQNRAVAMLRAGGNKRQAAALLGIERTTLYKKRAVD